MELEICQPVHENEKKHKLIINSTKRWVNEHRKILIIGIVWIAVFISGFLGLSEYYKNLDVTRKEYHSIWDILYYSFQLFTFGNGSLFGSLNWELQLARFLAPAWTISATFFAIAYILRDQFQLLLLRKHIVICGLGDKGMKLTDEFLKKRNKVVVIENNVNNVNIRQCREKGVIVLIGNAADIQMLRKARVMYAKKLIAACGEDGTNAEIAFNARSLLNHRKGDALTCYAHLKDVDLFNFVQEWAYNRSNRIPYRVEFFNVFESGAKALLEQYKSLYEEIFKPEYFQPHLVVIGAGQMGSSLIVELARRWENDSRRKSRKLNITLIDLEPEGKKDLLLAHYPELAQVCDIIPKRMNVKSSEFEKADFLSQESLNRALIVFVCLDNDSRSVSAALTINDKCTELNTPIIVRMKHETGFSAILQNNDSYSRNLHAFSLLEKTCKSDLLFGCFYENMAKTIHELYIQSQKKEGVKPEENPAMVPWEDLMPDDIESNFAQAQSIPQHLREIGYKLVLTRKWHPEIFKFTEVEEETLAEKEHIRYVKDKMRRGFTWGPVKNSKHKKNPSLISWEELPDKIKDIDRMFAKNISRVIAMGQFEIRNDKVKDPSLDRR